MEEPATNQFNFQNLWNIEIPKLLEEKFITVEVHEAKLNHKASTSSGGKLATFVKLQVSTLVWTTKLDKDSTQNPRWGQSKTFQRKTLEKYSKSEERIVGDIIIRHFLPHRPSERNAQPAQDQTPNLILGVYHYSPSTLMEALIGETKIPLKDILKKNSQNGWYDITHGSQISGSVHLAFKYDDVERETSKGNSQNYDVQEPAESRSQTPTYKDQNRTIKPSTFGTPFSLDESQSNLLSIYSNYNVSNDEDEIIQNFSVYQPFTFEKSRLNKSSTKSSQIPDEDQYDFGAISTNATPIKEQDKTRERQATNSSDNLLTTKFTEEDNDSPDKIVYNITFTKEDLEEPVVLLKDSKPKIIEVGQIQETLQSMQKDNIELKQKQEEFAVNFAKKKSEFEKLLNEQNLLSSRINDLSLREQCLVNEKRNLSKDFKELQREQDRFYNEESQQNEMQLMLEEAQREEYEETERTLELEENLKQIAIFYQRETQNMRALEQEMYRKLICQRIKEHNLLSEVEPQSEQIMVSMVEGYEKAPEPQEDEEINYEVMLQGMQDKQFEIETSIEARIQNIERLQELLKAEPDLEDETEIEFQAEVEGEVENNENE